MDLLTAFLKLNPEALVKVGGNACQQARECADHGANDHAGVWAAVAYTADQALTQLVRS